MMSNSSLEICISNAHSWTRVTVRALFVLILLGICSIHLHLSTIYTLCIYKLVAQFTAVFFWCFVYKACQYFDPNNDRLLISDQV